MSVGCSDVDGSEAFKTYSTSMTLSYWVLTGQIMASSTRPDKTLSRRKLRIPNLGGRSFPVLDRPPSCKSLADHSSIALSRVEITTEHTNKTFKVVTMGQ